MAVKAENMFISQSLLERGIPFDAGIPNLNQETEATMQEARDIVSGKKETKTYHSAGELFAEIDAE